MTESDQAPARAESGARLALRLALDLLAIIAFSLFTLAVSAAVAALAFISIRGLESFLGYMSNPGAIFSGMTQETLIVGAFCVGAALYLAVIAGVWLTAWTRRRRDWRDYIAWKPFKFERYHLLIGAAGLAWGLAIGAVIEAYYPESKHWNDMPHGFPGVIVAFILVVLLGPLCEELLFRGWLFTALRPKLGFIATLIATSALFAAAHWERTHLYALAVLPVGLLLGYARERSGGIKTTFAFHGIYNFMGWIIATFASK